MSVPEGNTFRVPVKMLNACGIGSDGKGRIVCVSPPYGIVRWGISAWLSDMPTGFLGPFAELRRANQLRHVWPSSVRLSAWRNAAPNEGIFMKLDI